MLLRDGWDFLHFPPTIFSCLPDSAEDQRVSEFDRLEALQQVTVHQALNLSGHFVQFGQAILSQQAAEFVKLPKRIQGIEKPLVHEM